jgi:hypothetical protein
MSVDEFDAVSLHPGENQQIVLGAVLDASWSGSREIGVQFVGSEPFPIASIVDWFHLVPPGGIDDRQRRVSSLFLHADVRAIGTVG